MNTCSSNVRKDLGSFSTSGLHTLKSSQISQNASQNSSTNPSVYSIPRELPTFHHQYCKEGIKAVLHTVHVDGHVACSEQNKAKYHFYPQKSQAKWKNLIWSSKWDDSKYVAANVEMWKILLPPACFPSLLICLPGRLWCPLELEVHWLFPVGISLELFDPQGNWNKNNKSFKTNLFHLLKATMVLCSYKTTPIYSNREWWIQIRSFQNLKGSRYTFSLPGDKMQCLDCTSTGTICSRRPSNLNLGFKLTCLLQSWPEIYLTTLRWPPPLAFEWARCGRECSLSVFSPEEGGVHSTTSQWHSIV